MLGARPNPVYVVRHSGIAAGGKATLAVLERFEGAARTDGDGRELASEARRIATLASPNLARVREVSVRGDDLVVVGEFVEGEKLQALWRPDKLPLEIALRVIIDALAGVGALHNLRDARQQPMNLAHGELSPATIVFGLDGIARVLHAVARRDPNVVPEAASLPYLAPEVAAGERYDARADVFGAGVLLWEALSGKRLFAGDNPADNARQVRAGPLPLATVPEKATWARGLVDVAARALAASPDDRWPTAAVMAAEIRKAAGLKLAPASTAAAFAKSAFGERVKARRESMDASTPSHAPKAGPVDPIEVPPVPAPAPLREPSFADLEMESVVETVLVAPGVRATVAEAVEVESDAIIEVARAVSAPPPGSSAPGGFVLDPFAGPAAPVMVTVAPVLPVVPDFVAVPEPAIEAPPPSITGAPQFAAAIAPPPPPAPAAGPWPPAPEQPFAAALPHVAREPARPVAPQMLDAEADEPALVVPGLRRRKMIVLGGVAVLGVAILLLVVARGVLHRPDTTPSAAPPPPTAAAASPPAPPPTSVAAPPSVAPVVPVSPLPAPPTAPMPAQSSPPPQALTPAKPPPVVVPASPPLARAAPAPAPVKPRPKPTFDPNTL